MDNILIVTGGNRDLQHYHQLLTHLKQTTYVIGVDAGALWLLENHLQIDLAVGDFDTIRENGLIRLEEEGVKIRAYNSNKDLTDTELAIEIAIMKNPKSIQIYGGIGNRFDHSLANVHLLWKSMRQGVSCEILDPFNRIQLVTEQLILQKNYPYVSLIPMSQEVIGVTLKGFKYPLTNAKLIWGNSLGISNEIEEDVGIIQVKEGFLLVIESRDL